MSAVFSSAREISWKNHVELAPVEREARPESGDCIYLKDLKKGPIDLEQEVAALEKRYMSEALKLSGNNLTRAAALLGVTRFSMKRKMEREDGRSRKAEKLYQEEGRKWLSGKPGAGMNGKRVQKITSVQKIARPKTCVFAQFLYIN